MFLASDRGWLHFYQTAPGRWSWVLLDDAGAIVLRASAYFDEQSACVSNAAQCGAMPATCDYGVSSRGLPKAEHTRSASFIRAGGYTDESAAVIVDGLESRQGAYGPVMQLKPTLERLGGDVDLFRELAGILLHTAPGQLRDIDFAIARGNLRFAYEQAHSLRGAVITFECVEVSRAVLDVERYARADEAVAAGAAFRIAKLMVNRLLQELQPYVRLSADLSRHTIDMQVHSRTQAAGRSATTTSTSPARP